VVWSGEDCAWTASPELDVFREYTSDPKVVRLRVIGYKAGLYRLEAIACLGGKLSPFSTCTVVVGDVPAPGPRPPEPTPPQPQPADPILADYQAAYAKEPNAAGERAVFRTGLEATYRFGTTAAHDAGLGDWGALFAAVQAEAKRQGSSGELLHVQAVSKKHFLYQLPTEPTTKLDSAGRALAADLFGKCAGYIAKLKE
jgi:hypothetical protein